MADVYTCRRVFVGGKGSAAVRLSAEFFEQLEIERRVPGEMLNLPVLRRTTLVCVFVQCQSVIDEIIKDTKPFHAQKSAQLRANVPSASPKLGG